MLILFGEFSHRLILMALIIRFQLGQPIRLILEYTGTDYEERLYEIGPAPDFDKSDWLRVKFNLGLDFPNVPYYMDGKMEQLLFIKLAG